MAVRHRDGGGFDDEQASPASWSRLRVSTALCWHLHLPWSPACPTPFRGRGPRVAVDGDQRTVKPWITAHFSLMPAMRMAFRYSRLSSFWDFRSVHWCDFRSQARASNGMIATIEPVGITHRLVCELPVLTSLAHAVRRVPPLGSARQSGPPQLLGHLVRVVSGRKCRPSRYISNKDRGLEVLGRQSRHGTIAKIQAFWASQEHASRLGWIVLVNRTDLSGAWPCPPPTLSMGRGTLSSARSEGGMARWRQPTAVESLLQ